MATKQAIEGKRQNHFAVEPESLVLVTDPKHYLYDPRNDLPVDEGLVLALMEYGVQHPVTINKDREIIDGRQRYKASVEANKRLKKAGREPLLIPVIVKKGDEGRLFGMSQTTFIRQDETITQKAAKVARYLDMGYSEDDAAVTFGVTKTAIGQWLSILDAPAEVRKAAEAGTISQSAAVKLAGLDAGDAKEALADMKASGSRSAKAAAGKVAGKKALREGKGEDTVRTAPSLPKRKIQKLVLAAARMQKDEAAATEAVEEGLNALIEKGGTYLDLFLLGMRVACGDRTTGSVKGLNDLIEETL